MSDQLKTKKYVKPEIATEKVGSAEGQPPMGTGPVCDATAVPPKKTGQMGDGCTVKFT